MTSSRDRAGSTLLLDEYFGAEDPRFLDELGSIRSGAALAAFTDRWKKDPRPWARRQIFAYLERPFDRPGHPPVVKRLFKHAEKQRDDELLAAFLAAFDRLIRRVRRKKIRWDHDARSHWTEEVLRVPRDVIRVIQAPNPRTGQPIEFVQRPAGSGRIFSHATRYHLRLRAWRYFRHMGFQRPKEYVAAVARALLRYRDEDLSDGAALLDSWGFVQACFRGSKVLRFGSSHVYLSPERSLAELAPAPRFLHLWKESAAGGVLFSLVLEAPARAIRVWAMEMLRTHHADRLASASLEDLFRLLDHADPEVQNFGADRLRSARGLETLPVADWLRLIETPNPVALGFVCEAMLRHVTADRLDFVQRLRMACAQPSPVARMGLDFLRARPPATAAERASLVMAGESNCPAIAGELARWTLSIAGVAGAYDREVASALLDSAQPDARAAAWTWLVGDSPGMQDPALWARLLETPYDDVRLRLVETLERRSGLPGARVDDLVPVWSAVLLGVLRGGRRKLQAVRQLGRALAADPSRADSLLPVLAVAIRSVRGPEMRAGLAAAVTAVEARPELSEALRRHVPELVLPR